MTQATSAKVTKLNRVERNAWTKQKIFDAATKVVGKYGYAEASVARITEAAGVAQGTFYNHFENRQELLDQLLPKIGLDMVRFIHARTGTANEARQEVERFSAFFDFIREVPEFLRILNEARVLRADRLPKAFRQYFERLRPDPPARAGRGRDQHLQRRGIRGHCPGLDGRTRLSQPALFVFRARRYRRA
ncbi:AcrR family transcriptional regulator [Bradyrhizobium sp. JR6.1]